MGQAKRNRTEEYRQTVIRKYFDEQATNAIEQRNFDKLIEAGIIKEEKK